MKFHGPSSLIFGVWFYKFGGILQGAWTLQKEALETDYSLFLIYTFS